MMPHSHILYSFRRCPFAIRARLAILNADIEVELREVRLRDKPASMTALSPKGTVPVLQLASGDILDESLTIIHWAFTQKDLGQWLPKTGSKAEKDCAELIAQNDGEFKFHLDRYKYASRYEPSAENFHRKEACKFIHELEMRLRNHAYLLGESFSLADNAILPFVRQFAAADANWFKDTPYREVRRWLNSFLTSDLFKAAMKKYPIWQAGDPPQYYP